MKRQGILIVIVLAAIFLSVIVGCNASSGNNSGGVSSEKSGNGFSIVDYAADESDDSVDYAASENDDNVDFADVECDVDVDDAGDEIDNAVDYVDPGVTLSLPESPATDEQSVKPLPDGFVYISDVIPDVIQEIRYYSTYNFMGARADDYLSPVAIISKEAADALKLVNADLRAQGYAIKVFDAYRPQGAVDHFLRWSRDKDDVLTKEYFYPDVEKWRLFPDGYLAVRSGHSRGSTVDLTLVDMRTGKEVDMGSPFDFFGAISSHGTSLITAEKADNRLILKNAMERAGFMAYYKEWWHYTLANEPYPCTYFSFPVE